MLNNQPSTWDIEVDFVSIGSGAGGLGAAITAHDAGGKALVIERADKVGGVTALSMGEVWVPGNPYAADLGVEDSPERGFNYLKRLSMGHADDRAILNLVIHAREALSWFEANTDLRMKAIRDCPDYFYGVDEDAVPRGRLLEVEPFPASTLGEWAERTRISPQMPFGLTHDDMYDFGGTAHIAKWDFAVMGDRLQRDERCLGPGLAAAFVKGVVDRGIPLMTGTEAVEIYGDGERVVGLRARQGDRDITIRAAKGVLLAVSSYERREDYNRGLSQQIDAGSLVFSTVDGANFRLAGPFNARISRVPDISLLGVSLPNEEDEEGKPLYRSCMAVIGLPHVIVVNRFGHRFANESFYRDYGFKLDAVDGNTQTYPNYPCWAIMDSQAREKYPFAGLMPGQELPEGFGHTAGSLAELAQMAGIDAAGLEATVAAFNPLADQGVDPVHHRGTHPWSAWMAGDRFHHPNPNLGSLVKAPFYAIPLKRMAGSAIPATGLLSDQHCRILSWADEPIPGLYGAGNSLARIETGAMMQSGISNARGITTGWLAARHAMGQPSRLLENAAIALS
ncbi:MAG: FAD-binding protein [Novosphingobium sp.]